MYTTTSKVLNIVRGSAIAFMLGALGLSQSVFAQTVTPGTPTTALGGMAQTNILLLAFSLSLIGIGTMIAYRTRHP